MGGGMPLQRARVWCDALQHRCRETGRGVASALLAAAKRLPGAPGLLCDGAFWRSSSSSRLPGRGCGRSDPASAEALCAFRACSRKCLRLDFEMGSDAWRAACEQHWGSKSSRFHLTDVRGAELAMAFPGAAWRQLYHSQMSAAREPFGLRHLTELSWAFNFTRDAGGCGLRTAQIVRFEDKSESMGGGLLHMRGHQPLPCRLHDDSVLQIANFPPHGVRRLPSWEWRISNANVILLSGPLLPVELSVEDTIRNLHAFPDSGLLGIPEDGP